MNVWQLGLPSLVVPFEPLGAPEWLYPGVEVDVRGAPGHALITERGSDAQPLRMRPGNSSAAARLPGPGRTLWARIGAVDSTDPPRVWLQLLAVEVAHTLARPLAVRVDDFVIDDLRARFGVEQRLVPRWLLQQFVNEERGHHRILTRHLDVRGWGGFTLVGAGLAMDLRPDDGRYIASRISKARHGTEAVVAANGDVQFTTTLDEWQATEVERTAALLGGNGSASSGLHTAYQRWLEVEVARLARSVAEVGVVTVFDALDGVGGLEVDPSELPEDVEAVRIGSRREAAKAMHSLTMVVASPRSATADLLAALQAVRAAVPRQAELGRDGRLVLTGSPVARGRDQLVAVAMHAGDLQQLVRRSKALERAATTSDAVPLLALAMGDRSGMPQPRPIRLRPAEVRAAFNGEPTPSQLDALEVALNTPDVAVIQGPPGTGKTRLLTALRTVVLDREENGSGLPAVLLTGPQHDAVDNLVAAGAAPTAIPAARLGERAEDRHRDGGADPYGGQVTAAWARHLAGRLDQAGRPSALANARNRLSSIEGTLRVRGVAAVDDYRAELLSIARQHASGAAHRELASALGDTNVRRDDELSRLVRRVRVTEQAFSDDGPFVIRWLLRALDGASIRVTVSQRKLLNRLAAEAVQPTVEELAELTELKAELLGQLQAGNAHGLPTRLTSAIAGVKRDLDQKMLTSANCVEDALAEFREALLADPAAVRDAVRHYADAYALTCAFAGADELNKALQGDDDPETAPVRIGTVIVDEAARANPLDLLITAQRSRRRVVLVGDQNQLPPMIEREQLEELTDREREQVREPLFKVLFESMSRLAASDGVRRAATLTEQFRMHPRLGEFISKTFYQPTGVVLTSARSESDYPAAVEPFGPGVAVWCDVPAAEGPDEGRPSRWRRPEVAAAERVVESVLRRSPELSVGVIAMYSEQARRLLAALSPLEQPDRLWVGTVDGSQGREFDVVVLSTVRSATPRTRKRGGEVALFGHLANANRLCVAFSRARRLVVVVGDRDFLTGTDSDQHVPAMRAFAELVDREAEHA